MMKHFLFFLLIIQLSSCKSKNDTSSQSSSKKELQTREKESKELNEYRTSFSEFSLKEIISSIQLHEYLQREKGGRIYSNERLKKIKDSINYDSIQANTEISVFE